MLCKKAVLDLFTHLQPYQSALDYHLERHSVLVSNIAHVDTPGYVPQDLARTDSFASAFQTALARTREGHLTGSESLPTRSGKIIEDPSAGAGLDGNAVSLDREAAKVAANQVRYDVDTAILSAELSLLAYAANDGRGA